jgi:hypothetical protein
VYVLHGLPQLAAPRLQQAEALTRQAVEEAAQRHPLLVAELHGPDDAA